MNKTKSSDTVILHSPDSSASSPKPSQARGATPPHRNLRNAAIGGAGAAAVAGGALVFAQTAHATTNEDIVEPDEFVDHFRPDEHPTEIEAPAHNAEDIVSPAEIDMDNSGVDDSMSFAEAFAAARHDQGAGGTFHWRGGTYGTDYADEHHQTTHHEAEIVEPDDEIILDEDEIIMEDEVIELDEDFIEVDEDFIEVDEDFIEVDEDFIEVDEFDIIDEDDMTEDYSAFDDADIISDL